MLRENAERECWENAERLTQEKLTKRRRNPNYCIRTHFQGGGSQINRRLLTPTIGSRNATVYRVNFELWAYLNTILNNNFYPDTHFIKFCLLAPPRSSGTSLFDEIWRFRKTISWRDHQNTIFVENYTQTRIFMIPKIMFLEIIS